MLAEQAIPGPGGLTAMINLAPSAVNKRALLAATAMRLLAGGGALMSPKRLRQKMLGDTPGLLAGSLALGLPAGRVVLLRAPLRKAATSTAAQVRDR
jgi:hypothetical protein